MCDPVTATYVTLAATAGSYTDRYEYSMLKNIYENATATS